MGPKSYQSCSSVSEITFSGPCICVWTFADSRKRTIFLSALELEVKGTDSFELNGILSFLGKMAPRWSSAMAASVPTARRPSGLPLPVHSPPARSGAEGRRGNPPELRVKGGFLLKLTLDDG